MGDGVVHLQARLRYSPIHSESFVQEPCVDRLFLCSNSEEW